VERGVGSGATGVGVERGVGSGAAGVGVERGVGSGVTGVGVESGVGSGATGAGVGSLRAAQRNRNGVLWSLAIAGVATRTPAMTRLATLMLGGFIFPPSTIHFAPQRVFVSTSSGVGCGSAGVSWPFR
jgi:hypothetical protein